MHLVRDLVAGGSGLHLRATMKSTPRDVSSRNTSSALDREEEIVLFQVVHERPLLAYRQDGFGSTAGFRRGQPISSQLAGSKRPAADFLSQTRFTVERTLVDPKGMSCSTKMQAKVRNTRFRKHDAQLFRVFQPRERGAG